MKERDVRRDALHGIVRTLALCSCAVCCDPLGAASLQLLGLTGQSLPDLPAGVVINGFGDVAIGPDGTLAVVVELAGAGVDDTNESALLTRQAGETLLHLQVREGESPVGGGLSGQISGPQVSRNGVLFVAGTSSRPRPAVWEVDATGTVRLFGEFGGTSDAVTGNWVSEGALFMATSTTGSLLFPSTMGNAAINAGDPAPGMPAGYTISTFQDLQIGENGRGAFSAWLRGTNGSVKGLYTVDLGSGSASPSLAVHDGDVSRAGETFSSVSYPTVVDDELFFFGFSRAASSLLTHGIWRVDSAGSVHPVLLEGDPVDQFGNVYYTSPYLTVQKGSPSTILIQVGLEKNGVFGDALVQYELRTGGLQPVLLDGDPLAGSGGNAINGFDFGGMDYNEPATIAFVGGFGTAGAEPSGTSLVYFDFTPQTPVSLVQTGRSVVAGASCERFDIVTIEGGGGRPGRPRGMNAGISPTEIWATAGLDADGDGNRDATALLLASPEGNTVSLGCENRVGLIFSDGFGR